LATFHYIQDRAFGSLAADVSAADTTFQLNDGHTVSLSSFPFWMSVEDEKLEVTGRSGNILTVKRGQLGSVAAAHRAGAHVFLNIIAAQVQEIHDVFAAFLAAMMGEGDGVLRTAGSPFFAVTELDTPAMGVQVAPGYAFISKGLFWETSALQFDLVAPSTNNRKDLVQATLGGTVTIKTGVEAGSPVVPSPDDDSIALAEIALTTATTEIENAAITDRRVFL
jgi:hypothetical protein